MTAYGNYNRQCLRTRNWLFGFLHGRTEEVETVPSRGKVFEEHGAALRLAVRRLATSLGMADVSPPVASGSLSCRMSVGLSRELRWWKRCLNLVREDQRMKSGETPVTRISSLSVRSDRQAG